jgi:hypothetical protein
VEICPLNINQLRTLNHIKNNGGVFFNRQYPTSYLALNINKESIYLNCLRKLRCLYPQNSQLLFDIADIFDVLWWVRIKNFNFINFTPSLRLL